VARDEERLSMIILKLLWKETMHVLESVSDRQSIVL